jgi:hypothetical protein
MGRVRFAKCLLVGAAAASAADACAIGVPDQQRHAHCSVIGIEKLPADIGGADAICDAINRAVAARVPTAHFTAEVKVLSASRVTTRLTVNERALPEQNFAVMDRNLNQGSIERFAQSIAAAIAQAIEA